MEDYHISRSLFHAVRSGQLQRIRELINSYGMSYSPDWSDGYALLIEAIKNKHAAVAKLLLSRGSRVNASNGDNSILYSDTPLHFAAMKNYVDIVDMLLEKGAKIDAKNNIGRTPLNCVVINKNMKATELLLNRGADSNATDETGKGPLHYAVKGGSLQIVEQLLKHTAHVNWKVTKGEKKGYTPLHIAVEMDNKEMAKFLISKGADINSEGKDDLTPLHIAAMNGNICIVEDLLNHGACIDSITMKNGYTPLHIAVRNFRLETVKLLLKYGAKVDFRTKKGKTLLHLCAKYVFNETIEIILKLGVDVNSRDKGGRTALHIATKNGDVEMVKSLLELGSDINIVNKKNLPPLQYVKVCSYDSDDDTEGYFTNLFYSDDDDDTDYTQHDSCDSDDDIYDRQRTYFCKTKGTIVCNYDEIAEALEHHLIKMRSANLHVCKENLDLVDFGNYVLFQDKCKEELASMMNEKINGNVSFYDILTKNRSSLNAYMNDEKVVEVLTLGGYETKFPMYASIIKNQFKKCMERKMILESSRPILYLLFGNYPQLPYICMEKILSYIDDQDLTTLMKLQLTGI